jgi:uncharacterized protein YijF (DUF1287 family)
VDAQPFNATAEKSQDFEGLTTAEIVTWALANYNPWIGLACCFQAESACRPLVVGNRDTKECALHVSAEAKV